VTQVPPVPVVCALIERGGRVLLAQRPAHKHLALKWEFPGGKVDAGETAEAALIREIREELACAVAIVRPLPRFTHAYERATIEMIPFVCGLTDASPEPQPAEHLALAWVLPGRLRDYDLAAADGPVVGAYLAGLAPATPGPAD
jgi:mutator protein MutT